MANLSPAYLEVKRLRSRGECAAAIAQMRTRPPASDDDAFEAAVCLFLCGDGASALNVCRTYPWSKNWAVDAAAALAEMLATGQAARALERARRAARTAGAPHDVAAIYLRVLQETGAFAEVAAFMRERAEAFPSDEPFLLTVMAEAALALEDWRYAYRCASAVLAHDPDDYRALLALSHANFGIGNLHEALGNAKRAATIELSPPVILQIMRCENKLGDHYAALAALEKIPAGSELPQEMRLELATAYAAVGERAQAVEQYQALLAQEPPPVAALRKLLELHAFEGEDAEIDALHERFRPQVENDFTSMYWIGISALHRGDLDAAARAFAATHALAPGSAEALHDSAWPVPEPRRRHDL